MKNIEKMPKGSSKASGTLTGARPVVNVLEPSLRVLAGGRAIPHLYSQEREELCVYLPARLEWNPEKWLSHTVLRWSVLWLYFFEDWLGGGEWHGGGEHPRPMRDRRRHGQNRPRIGQMASGLRQIAG